MRNISRLTAGLLSGLLLYSCALQADDREYLNPSMPDGEGLPFSGGVMIDDVMYLSGMLGLVDGKVPDTPEEEARAMLDGVKAALAEVDMTMDDIFVVQMFCSDVAHYGAFNDVYRTYFTKEFPARAFIGSGPLLFGARFEIMVTARKR